MDIVDGRCTDDEYPDLFGRRFRVVRPLGAVRFDDEHVVGRHLVSLVGRLDVKRPRSDVEHFLLIVVVVVGEWHLLAGVDFVDVHG